MPKFDLKDAEIKFKDGYAVAGAINNGAGEAAGNSTIAVDGFTTAIANGETFKVGSDTTTYTVTAHTETLGKTTAITFTPVLAAKANDNAVVQFQPHTLTVEIGEGNVSYTEKRNVEYQRDRGTLDTVRLGDEEPLDVSFDFTWKFLTSETGATVPTIEEVLKRTGPAADWVTAADDTCEPYAIDIYVEYTPLCEDQQKELIILKDFRYEQLAHDMKGGTVSCTGKCNVTDAIVDRVDNF